MASESAGSRLAIALAAERPLQIVGAVNAYAARLAEVAGFRALYVSGGGVAASSRGLPDLGIITLDDVLTDVQRLTDTCNLPTLVDIDTGWGGGPGIDRAVKALARAGAAGVHIEDQVAEKRCGHRPGKLVVPVEEMLDRIRAAVDARDDPSFTVMARTDAGAVEGLEAAIERAQRYVDVGASMVFPEALATLDEYHRFVEAVNVPVLANVTEFGLTPLFTLEELRAVGVRLALYPLSAFRAMSAAALQVYRAIREDGTQRGVLGLMQTREELYRHLDYERFERRLDELFARRKD